MHVIIINRTFYNLTCVFRHEETLARAEKSTFAADLIAGYGMVNESVVE